MKFETLPEARKTPNEVTELDLSWQSTGKPQADYMLKEYVMDMSKVSTDIGPLSEFRNLRGLKISAFPIDDVLLHSLGDLKNLETLTFWNTQLNAFPEIVKELPALCTLAFVFEHGISKIPDWIQNLTALKSLSISGCDKLASLPVEITKMSSLEKLTLSENHKLVSIPEGILEMPNLSKDSKKEITKLLQKIAKKKEKLAGNKLTKNEALLEPHLNHPVNYTCGEQQFRGTVFLWSLLDEDLKSRVGDQLDDEMSEEANLVPFAVFTFAEGAGEFTTPATFFEKNFPEQYLMYNKKNLKVFASGNGYTEETLKTIALK